VARATTAALGSRMEDDMGTITTSFFSDESFVAGVAATAKRVVAAAGRLIEAWNNRRGLTMLSRMDERGLADIGLSRSDVRDALSRRGWDGPTEELTARRGARGMQQHRAPPLVTEPGFARPRTDRSARHTV